MAAKRLQENEEGQENKRPRGSSSSLPSDLREILLLKSMPNNIAAAIEPLLRRAVREELELVIERRKHEVQRRSSFRLQELTEAPILRLSFKGKLALPIYTNSNIEAEDNNPLEIFIIDGQTGKRVHHGFPASLKVEILVLNGDFPPAVRENWTSEEFNSNLVRQRNGKRPLLEGDLNIILRDGVGLIRVLALTDNSSWIRSRRFRLGARIVKDNNGVAAIGEALSEAFIVRDHRGESYKKHHPPLLNDEVWRLEKIGKDGAFDKRLAALGIRTVQDFLRTSVKDPTSLRTILGLGMSDKMWEVTINHARTCNLGDKLYFHHDINQRCLVVLNSICQPVAVICDGYLLPMDELNAFQKAEVAKLVEDAYNNWGKLKEVEGGSRYNNLLPSSNDIDRALAAISLNSPTTSSHQRIKGQLEASFPDIDASSYSASTQATQFQNAVGQLEASAPDIGASSYSASRQEIQFQNAASELEASSPNVGASSYSASRQEIQFQNAVPIYEHHHVNGWLFETQQPPVASRSVDLHPQKFNCCEAFSNDTNLDENYGP